MARFIREHPALWAEDIGEALIGAPRGARRAAGRPFLVALAILTLVSFLINFVRQLNRMLGPGTLVNLLLGRYHRPVAEDRIFMFLDLNDSTAIAELRGKVEGAARRRAKAMRRRS
jgi:hypothetical protein